MLSEGTKFIPLDNEKVAAGKKRNKMGKKEDVMMLIDWDRNELYITLPTETNCKREPDCEGNCQTSHCDLSRTFALVATNILTQQPFKGP